MMEPVQSVWDVLTVVVMSEEKMLQLGLKPLARIVSYADAEV